MVLSLNLRGSILPVQSGERLGSFLVPRAEVDVLDNQPSQGLQMFYQAPYFESIVSSIDGTRPEVKSLVISSDRCQYDWCSVNKRVTY